jgi:hypothetical protein
VLKFATTAVTAENIGKTGKSRCFPNETTLASYLIFSHLSIAIDFVHTILDGTVDGIE